MTLKKSLYIACLTFGVLTTNGISAETTDYEMRQATSAALELRIKEREIRLTEQANDIVRLHLRMGDKLDNAVKRIVSIKDSAKSGYRVSKAKLAMISGLQNAVEKFQQNRDLAFKAFQKRSTATKNNTQTGELKHFDSHIEKHIDQIIQISRSFTQDTNVKKYEKSGDLYYDGYFVQESSRISDEYRQNRRDRIMDKKQKEEVRSALNKSTSRCKKLISNLKNNFNQKK